MAKFSFKEEIEPLISIFSTLNSSISSTPKKNKQPRILESRHLLAHWTFFQFQTRMFVS